MIETLKNFFAMVFASALWVLGLLLIVAVYILFQDGPVLEEFVFLAVVGSLFTVGVFITLKNERLKSAALLPMYLAQ